MKKQIGFFLQAAICLVAVPAACSYLSPKGPDMTVCMILFLGIDPLFFLIFGYQAGKEIEKFWYMPLVAAAFFILGAWAFLDLGNFSFLRYALMYSFMGILSMLMTRFFHYLKIMAQQEK